MAPADTLSPAGSSTYSSNTMYVGDGTWDSTRNNFLLPNLVGLNFDTMQYNGMGNRFASLDEYHVLIQGHGGLAVIVFLFILPASIMIARFRPSGFQFHIYLNILAVFLTTIILILGWSAVGPSRSLTNPHHGIGLAIYVLILVQTMGGAWVRGKLRKKVYRRLPIKLRLHQWLGRAIALLGIAQVPLGLTLYGSPKSTFVLYTLWMTFLLLLYFILSYRRAEDGEELRYSHNVHEGGTVIQDRKSGGIGRWLAPLAAGAGLAALLGRRRDKKESRRESRAEVIPSRRGSRRGSGSYIEEEKYTDDRSERGGIMNKLIAGAAVLGAGAMAKSFFDRRKRNRDEEAYSAVAPDTPSRRRRSRMDEPSDISEESVDVRRVEQSRRHGPLLPGPGDPLATANVISAAQSRPTTPRPVGRPLGQSRRDSFSDYDSTASPSRREDRQDHTVRNTVLGGIGLGWLAKKYKDRKDQQEQQRHEKIRAQEIEDERRLDSERRYGNAPRRFTGDGYPGRNNRRRAEVTDSESSSDLTESHVERRRGTMPPLAAAVIPAAAAAAGATIAQSRSRHDITEPVPRPPMEPRTFHESGSEAYVSAGGREHRRHSSSRGRVAETAAASAAGAALGMAASEERRRREQSRGHQSVESPAVTLKVKMHGDKDPKVTLRRLPDEEATAGRNARRGHSRRRADSVSSLSGTDTAAAASQKRYRRGESGRRDAEAAAEERVMAGDSPLSPPKPAFAGGRQPKDSSYYSGGPPPPPESHGSPDSHGTRSGLSPSGAGTGGREDPAERSRRRRLERNQRQAIGTVDYQ